MEDPEAYKTALENLMNAVDEADAAVERRCKLKDLEQLEAETVAANSTAQGIIAKAQAEAAAILGDAAGEYQKRVEFLQETERRLALDSDNFNKAAAHTNSVMEEKKQDLASREQQVSGLQKTLAKRAIELAAAEKEIARKTELLKQL